MERDALATRRGFLGGVLGALFAAGCGGAPTPLLKVSDVPLAPLHRGPLTDLLPLADLRWVLLVKPREIAAIPWLIPEIGLFAGEPELDRFAQNNGFDLRQIPEAAVATYASKNGETTLWLARHNGDAAAVERLFRKRLTTGELRAADRPDVVRVSGKIGVAQSTLAVIGPDVIGLQQGGSASRGPARIAGLYAQDRLKKSPTVLAEDPLKSLADRFGSAPMKALALGPFEGELARGARGLLGGATAIGASARPSAREGIAVVIAVAGDFSKSGEPASHELGDAWRDLASGSFGHLLGLDQPVEPPLTTFSPEAVAVAVELNPQKLGAGLAEATGARVREVLR